MVWTIKIAVALVAIVLLTALGLNFVFARPFGRIDEQTIVMYVGSCPFSRRTFEVFQHTPIDYRLPRILPVPVDQPSAVVVCPEALRRLRERSLDLWLIPSGIACERLLEDAGAFHEKYFMGFPAYSFGRFPLKSAAVQPVFSFLGYDYTEGMSGGKFKKKVPRSEAPAGDMSDVVASPIGL